MTAEGTAITAPPVPIRPLEGRRDVSDPQAALTSPDAAQLGRFATNPAAIPWAGWKRVLRRTGREITSDRISLVAAGCAFYGTLALFPAISMLISAYGLVFNPITVEPQLATLQDLLPQPAYQLIAQRVHLLIRRPPSTLTVGLLVSTAVALWSSATGVKALLAALNLAYEERERRPLLRYQATAFGMTLLALAGAVVGLGLLLGLHPALSLVGARSHVALLARRAGLAVLTLFMLGALALLYRFGPSRRPARWVWVVPGSLIATALWLVASIVFSAYVGRLAHYDALYGPLGAVVGIMMWFFVTAYVVLLGAELNAELELQTASDSTQGPPRPIGTRGAYVADHVARH